MLTFEQKKYIARHLERRLDDAANDKVLETIIVDGHEYSLVLEYYRIIHEDGNGHTYILNIHGVNAFPDYWDKFDNGSEYVVEEAWNKLKSQVSPYEMVM